MTERDPNASLNECSYKPCRHYFRCQCHEQHAIARRGQNRNIIRRWSPHVPRIMYSRLFRREIRAFQVNTEDGWALPNDGIGCLQCKSHFFVTIGYESGQQRGSPEFSVGRCYRANPIQGRLIVEEHIPAAVHLQINESRSKPCTLR